MNPPSLICTAAMLALLAACGGGTGAEMPAADHALPAGATASPQAYSAYVGSLGADDRAEPLDVNQVQAPTSETAEPIEVG